LRYAPSGLRIQDKGRITDPAFFVLHNIITVASDLFRVVEPVTGIA